MAAHTMGASTFLNAQQVDYGTFRQETLQAIEYVRQHQPQPTAGGRAGAGAHA
jgi:hypothetical protein